MGKRVQTYDTSEAVTINTDASFDPILCTGGYGVWIKSDFFTIKRWGQFKGVITDSNEAEIKGIVNALALLKKNTRKFKLVVINCDNKTAREIIIRRKYNERFRVESEKLLEFLKDYEVVKVKSIRGHKSSYNARQYVNNWCDMNSREYKKVKSNV